MRTTWRDYWDLTKPKVVALIVFTALVGMCLAIPGLPTTAQVVTGLNSLGPFGGFAHHEHGLAQRGRLFLHTARVGDDEVTVKRFERKGNQVFVVARK